MHTIRTFRSMVQQDVFTLYTCTIEKDEELNKPLVSSAQPEKKQEKKAQLDGSFVYKVKMRPRLKLESSLLLMHGRRSLEDPIY